MFPFNSLVENAYITNVNFSLDNAKSSKYMMNNTGPRIEP